MGEPGEPLNLTSDDGYWYVREPVATADALVAVENLLHERWVENHDEAAEPFACPRLGTGRRLRARFVPAVDPDGEWSSELRLTKDDHKRGSFGVLEVLDLDAADRRKAERDAAAAAYTALLNDIAARWPDVQMDAERCSPAAGRVVFHLPGLAASIETYQTTWPTVYVQNRDLETFRARYGEAA